MGTLFETTQINGMTLANRFVFSATLYRPYSPHEVRRMRAMRDILSLVEWGVLEKDSAGGRSTSYSLREV